MGWWALHPAAFPPGSPRSHLQPRDPSSIGPTSVLPNSCRCFQHLCEKSTSTLAWASSTTPPYQCSMGKHTLICLGKGLLTIPQPHDQGRIYGKWLSKRKQVVSVRGPVSTRDHYCSSLTLCLPGILTMLTLLGSYSAFRIFMQELCVSDSIGQGVLSSLQLLPSP